MVDKILSFDIKSKHLLLALVIIITGAVFAVCAWTFSLFARDARQRQQAEMHRPPQVRCQYLGKRFSEERGDKFFSSEDERDWAKCLKPLIDHERDSEEARRKAVEEGMR